MYLSACQSTVCAYACSKGRLRSLHINGLYGWVKASVRLQQEHKCSFSLRNSFGDLSSRNTVKLHGILTKFSNIVNVGATWILFQGAQWMNVRADYNWTSGIRYAKRQTPEAGEYASNTITGENQCDKDESSILRYPLLLLGHASSWPQTNHSSVHVQAENLVRSKSWVNPEKRWFIHHAVWPHGKSKVLTVVPDGHTWSQTKSILSNIRL